MNIITVEHYFEYQMKQAIKQVLQDYEHESKDFANGDDLMAFLWENRKDFGEQILNQMGEWQYEDEWLEAIQES